MDPLKELNRLGKWRKVFASWQLGTRPETDGEYKAVRDHREVTILLRAEVSALTGLLIEKGVFTGDEFTAQVEEEAAYLNKRYESKFPGFRAIDDGMVVDVAQAQKTMKDMNFPP
jgi:hypothetical protein